MHPQTAKLIRNLREAIEDVEAAASESELDERSHGSKAKGNRQTLQNRIRYMSSANDLIEGLRALRVIAADDPCPALQKALADIEARILRYIARFDDPNEQPPGEPHERTRLH